MDRQKVYNDAEIEKKLDILEKSNRWVIAGAICSIVFSISLFICFIIFKIDTPEAINLSFSTLIIAFIGVLATIVVVRNDSQVKEVKGEFEKKIIELEKVVNENVSKTIEDYKHEAGAVSLQLAGMLHLGLMEKDIKRAFSLFIQAIDELNSANNKVPLDGIVSYIEYLIKDERVYLQDISDDEITRYLNICAKSTRAHELTQLLLSIKSPVLQNNVNV